MRTRLLAAVCVMSLTAEAHAQEPAETDAADVVDETPEKPDKKPAQNAPNSREVHTVVRGDTLWDLSERYLGSPWYWPKVWSHNPEIANPHWIYPGNNVRFAAAGEEVPSEIDITQEDEGGDGEISAGGELENDGVSVEGKIGYQGNGSGNRYVRVSGFVTQKELDEAGRITGSFEEKEMLSFPDRAYVKFKNASDARMGDKYLVFRTEKQAVKHPLTGKKLGYMTHILGTMKVVAMNEKTVTTQVMDSREDILRGHLVGPAGEALERQVVAKPNTKAMEAVVITALVPYLSIVGEHHIIVIDRGVADGVEPGNTFVAYRQSDFGGNFMNPAKPDTSLPKEDIATCVTVEVKDRLSTCLLTRSIREVIPGDRVEMRVDGAKTASR